ncbi:hypothetical protein Hdeb2414_s0002g00047011 [Helianthus debilis subsp. tardiflorus]
MQSKRLGFLVFLLCVHFLSSLAFESQEVKLPIVMNGNSYGGEDGVKHNELVLSKAGKGKGAYGGQNNRPPVTKKSKGASMLLNELGYMQNIVISVITATIILVFNL